MLHLQFIQLGGGPLPSFMQEVNVSIVGANECKCQYQNLTEITENMICAGLRAGESSPYYVIIALSHFLDPLDYCFSVIVSEFYNYCYSRLPALMVCPMCFIDI